MREVTVSIFLLGLFFFVGCKSDAQEDPCTSDPNMRTFPGTQVSLDATAECINAIHTRLVSLRQDYPQLSDVNRAAITATNLSYAKGKDLYEGKPEYWSSPDACMIVVRFEKYSPAETWQQGGGRKFPEAGIQVYYYEGSDSQEFRRVVSSTIREEIERFGKSLE